VSAMGPHILLGSTVFKQEFYACFSVKQRRLPGSIRANLKRENISNFQV